MSNKNCGPDIVKYFVVEPVGGTVTGYTGDFYVCSGTTFVNTISGCTDSVNFNNNIFYNNGQTFFSNTLSACTGIYTSNLYGCSPITVHDNLILLSGLTFNTISGDNSLTQILVRDGITGEVKYRDVSSITPDTNTFVTGGTYNSTTDIITLTRNDGGTIDITGVTDNFVVAGSYSDVTDTISLLRQDGSFVNITGVTDTFTTGATYDNGTALVTFTKNDGTSFTLDLSTIDVNDTFVTGGTLSGNNLILEKNNGVDVNPIDLSGLVSSKTDLTLFNSHTGDTNNPHQTSFSNLISTAHTHSISEVINLQTELDSKTDLTLFNTHTGDTNNPHQTSFANLTSTAHTHTISDIINLQTELDSKLDITTFNTYSGNVQTELNTKISGATNLSSEGIFAQKNGLDLEFKGITSTGGTVNISSNSNSVNLEVTIPADQDKFVSGGTYNGGTQEINFVGNSPETTFDVDLTSLVNSVTGDTFVTEGSYNPTTDIITLTRNDAVTIDITGVTDNFVVAGSYSDVTDTVSLLRQDGSFVNITGVTDTFTTGATYDNGTALATFTKNDGTTYTLDLSTIDVNDTFVTGFTFNPSTYDLTIKQNEGQPDLVSNLAVLASDVYVVSGVYNPSTGIVTYTNSSGGTFQVSGFTTGMTDSYTTAANLNGETIEFDNNIQGSNLYNVSLTPILSGKTDLTLFNTHTGDTNNPHETSFSNLTSTAHTHSINEVINLQTELDSKLNITDFNTYSGNVQTQLDGKIENGINSGGANEVFSGKSGTDLYFRTLSGGSNTTITTINDIIRVDVTIPPDTNTFVTGGTYNPTTDVITLTRNDGNTIDITGVTDTFTTGGTYNDTTAIITFTKNDSTTYDVDLTSLPVTDDVTIEVNSSNEIALKEVVEAPTGGTRTFDSFITITSGLTLNNLGTGTSVNNLGIDINGNVVIGTTGGTDTNTYVTGGTFSSETLTLDRNDGGSVVVTGFTSGGGDNFYVTGFTYNDANTFTISRNGGLGDLTSTINSMTGLTVNGNIDVIGDINVTGTTFYTNITGTSLGVDYIDFNNTLSPLPTDQEGRIYWDEDNGTLSLGMHGGQVVQQVGLEQYYYVKNQSGATIENGRVVRSSGTLGASGRILGEYMIADGTIPPKFTLGIATEDIVNGDDGYVTEFGLVRGVNTTGSLYGESWSGGTILWVSPTIPGGLTSVEPQAPNLKIEMAIVINAASNGSMFVRPNRYPYLYDIQQVNYSAGTENNLDILQWNSSNLTWDKTNTPSFNTVSVTTISGDTLTINGDTTLNTLTATSITSNSAIDVFNGHINLRDNSFFLQGRTVGDSNVSLIGVDNQDRVFVGNAGYDTYINSDTIVDGSLTATTYYGDGSNLSGTTPWSQSGTSIYYNDGNVGIGVSDPTFNLDIVSSGGTSSFENISRFRTIDSTDYLAITNAVSTDGSFNPVIRSFNNTNTSTNLYIQSVIDPSVDTGVNPLIMLQGRVNTEPGVDPWSGVTTRPIVRVRNNSTNLLDVTANGKVGIGTTTPSHKLSILGSNGSFETRVDGSLPYTSEIYAKTTNPSGSSVVQIVNDNVSSIVMGVLGSNRDASIAYGGESDDAFIFASTAANNLHIFNNSGTGTEDSIKFYAGNTATSTPHLHIQGSGITKGYVGIGTTTPSEKLDVVGNTKISGTLNIGTLGTGTSVTNLGIDGSGNVVSGNTNTGIYGGNGTIPLNTTASVNGDLTFQGLDEDTRIILKDGNNGGEVHLFSDGSAGQSALEFYNPGGATLTSKIQNAGGDTRFISNNRDLLFTTNTGVTTEGIFIQAGTGNMGIGTTTPSEILEVVQNTERFRLNLDFVDGPQAALGTTRTDIVSRFAASDGVVSTTMNTIGFDWTGTTVYGNPGDSSIYSNTSANGISIISAPGTGTEDYIRFYAGGNPQTSTASMHIQGDGSTIGNVGIGTETPLVELHIKGDSSILRLETTSANNSNYIEFYDPSERKGWIGYPSSTSSTDALFIRNEEHGSKIIISNTDISGTSRTAIDIDGNHNVSLPFGDLDVSGTLTIGTLGTGTSVTNLGIDGSGNVVTSSGGASGVLGISNSGGTYTYYSDFASAIAAASAGDTIEMFADITETTNITVTLIDGITINGNGHTYTLDVDDTASAFTFAVASGTIYLNNIRVFRTGRTAGTTTGYALSTNTTSNIKCQGVIFENDYGRGIQAGGTSIYRAHIISYLDGIYAPFGSANVYDCIIEVTGTGKGTYLSSGTISNCHVKSGSGDAINNGAGRVYNSVGISTGAYGIVCNGEVYNSTGQSTSGVGIGAQRMTNCVGVSSTNTGINGEGRNCVGISTSGVGGSGKFYNSTLISSSNYAASGNGGKLVGSTAKSTSSIPVLCGTDYELSNSNVTCDWNNTGGHCTTSSILLTAILTNNKFKVANASAYCISAYGGGGGSTWNYANNTFEGSTTPIRPTLTQGIINTSDSQGNILI